ncbi:MAG: tetratricopeptide repeat protein [Flavobacteriales bacterium]|nr:tetratricopeptide repeat protein [Flavobacteriales bacterium]
MQDYPQYSKALALLREKKFDEALELYREASKSHPNDPNVWHDWGVCLFHLNKPLEALQMMNEAVRLQPEYSYRYSSRAYIRAGLKDVQGAIADYRIAIELDPEDAVALNNLGLLEEQLGYVKEAKEKFDLADELSKILEEKNIDMASAKSEGALRAPQIPNTPEEQSSLWKEINRVFSSSEGFKEYISFIKSGFKLKK